MNLSGCRSVPPAWRGKSHRGEKKLKHERFNLSEVQPVKSLWMALAGKGQRKRDGHPNQSKGRARPHFHFSSERIRSSLHDHPPGHGINAFSQGHWAFPVIDDPSVPQRKVPHASPKPCDIARADGGSRLYLDWHLTAVLDQKVGFPADGGAPDKNSGLARRFSATAISSSTTIPSKDAPLLGHAESSADAEARRRNGEGRCRGYTISGFSPAVFDVGEIRRKPPDHERRLEHVEVSADRVERHSQRARQIGYVHDSAVDVRKHSPKRSGIFGEPGGNPASEGRVREMWTRNVQPRARSASLLSARTEGKPPQNHLPEDIPLPANSEGKNGVNSARPARPASVSETVRTSLGPAEPSIRNRPFAVPPSMHAGGRGKKAEEGPGPRQ